MDEKTKEMFKKIGLSITGKTSDFQKYFTLKKQLISCLRNIGDKFKIEFFERDGTPFFKFFYEFKKAKKDFFLKDYRCFELYDELVDADPGLMLRMATAKLSHSFPSQYDFFVEKNKELIRHLVRSLASMSLLDKLL